MAFAGIGVGAHLGGRAGRAAARSRSRSTSAARQRRPLPDSSDGLPSALMRRIVAPSGVNV